jgi:hypothetical protein
MRRCILHLGHAKTASTYLQRTLHLNEAALAAKNYWLPSDFTAFGSYNFRDLALSTKTFSGNLEPVFYAAEARDHGAVDRYLHHMFYEGHLPNLILSSELYFYYFWEVRDLVRRANRAGFAVDIVVYLQRQDKAAINGYLQNVRNHGAHGPVVEFLETGRRYSLFQYAEILGKYQIAPPNRIVARTFEPAFLRYGDILGDFLFAAGVPLDAQTLARTPARPNPGLPLEWYELLRAFNRQEDRRNIEVLRSAEPPFRQRASDRTMAYYFSHDVRQYVLANYIAGNDALISTYLDDRSAEEQGFWRSVEPVGAGAEVDPVATAECLRYVEGDAAMPYTAPSRISAS